MSNHEKGKTSGANDERSTRFFPVEYIVNVMLSSFVQATGYVIDDTEDHVKTNEKRTPPETSYLERYSGNRQIDQHENAVANVYHDVEKIDDVVARIVNQ